MIYTTLRSVKKGVLKRFAKFTGKQQYQSPFFDKAVSLQLIKKETLTQVFSCEFCEFLRTPFSTEHLRVTTSGVS